MSNEQQTPAEPQKGLNPYDFIARFPGAPDKAKIDSWKQQVPGGRIKLKVSGDEKRVYIMRAISGLELGKLTQQILQQALPQEKLASELTSLVVCTCCLWTNASPTGQLTDQMLKASGSGLADTLHAVLSELSDYETPETIERLSVEL